MLGWSFVLSVLFTVISDTALKGVGYIAAFLILGAFILVGIIFDILGVAATSASEKPFHAMASRRVNGSKEALWLIRNAEKVSSFCNDVVGDISGIISGSVAAIIVARFDSDSIIYPLILTGMVAGLTVGGKALGKGFALSYNSRILYVAGKIINIFKKNT
ncbi:MAG: hypothetical protein GX541_00550 [Clostridiales bacterium]|jgi:uncharacterized protein YacL|nr:hypothetical protein [Clostridiales bacterium]